MAIQTHTDTLTRWSQTITAWSNYNVPHWDVVKKAKVELECVKGFFQANSSEYKKAHALLENDVYPRYWAWNKS